MNFEQAKQAVTKAEQAHAAAVQAVKDTQAAETTLRDQIAQAAYENQIAVLDSLKVKLPAAEVRARLAMLGARRAAEALAQAQAVLGHMTAHKKFFEKVIEGARRVASIDAELRIIAAEAHARILTKLEERQSAIAEARSAYAGIPGAVSTAVYQGTDPLAAQRFSHVVDALATVGGQG